MWRNCTKRQLDDMRYLIDAEYRKLKADRGPRVTAHYAIELRRELSVRNLQWARETVSTHEATLGGVPAILYSEDRSGGHGNFLRSSYQQILTNPLWAKRLRKVHTSFRRVLLSRDPDRKELDSSNSSDALLMNIFCHPRTFSTSGVCQLLGIRPEVEAIFGHKPRIPLRNGNGASSSEIWSKLFARSWVVGATARSTSCDPRGVCMTPMLCVGVGPWMFRAMDVSGHGCIDDATQRCDAQTSRHVECFRGISGPLIALDHHPAHPWHTGRRNSTAKLAAKETGAADAGSVVATSSLELHTVFA